jgi:hypothetical protein
MTGAGTGTMYAPTELTGVLETIPFPAAREDLLLHAIAAHATPRLIGDLRSLVPSRFEDADAVRRALRTR